MSEDKTKKKSGFFGRLFGGAKTETPPAEAEAPVAEVEIPAETEAPAASEATPAPAAEAETEEPVAPEAIEVEPEEAVAAPDQSETEEAEAESQAAEDAAETAAEAEPSPEPISELSPEPLLEAQPASEGDEAGVAHEAETGAEVAAEKQSWFARLRQGLSRSSNALTDNLASVLTKRRLDEETLDDIEDVLIRADIGVEMASRVRDRLAGGRYERGISPETVREVLGEEVAKVLVPVAKPIPAITAKPTVWLMVGVNGTGKTTTMGKLAHRVRAEGKRVMLAAGDTFRAAAIDQLKVWGERTGSEVVAHAVGSDAAGVGYDALERAKAEGVDLLVIDTAGRLQNKSGLMDELAKMVRVLRKFDESAPHEVLLVLDATTGQNAMNQVALFQDIAGVTGLVVTKLDGTARGGILVAIAERFGLPVYAIGIGEGIDDLEPFDAQDFARAIAGLGKENVTA